MPRKSLSVALAIGAVALQPLGAQAAQIKAGDLMIDGAEARPNLPNRPTAAYMTIVNEGESADILRAATSPAFGRVEMHLSLMDGDVMTMEALGEIELPAGQTVTLEPGGLHLMLLEPEGALKVGDAFPLTLTFQRAGDVEVEVQVNKVGHGGTGHSGHGAGDDHSGDGAHTN